MPAVNAQHSCRRGRNLGRAERVPLRCDSAFAYRPFDGTDAAVAEPGQLEIELGPGEPVWQGSERFLIAPALVLNFGLTKQLEAVLEGRLFTPLSSSDPVVLKDAAASLKYVVRPGVLQDKPGPSIATEIAVLFPDSAGDSNFGASWAGIVSQRWDWAPFTSMCKRDSTANNAPIYS